MKKQTKGILAFAFLGGLMLTSGVLIAIPGFDEDVDYAAMNDPAVTITGTPADNFPDNQRTTFCSSGGDAKSCRLYPSDAADDLTRCVRLAARGLS